MVEESRCEYELEWEKKEMADAIKEIYPQQSGQGTHSERTHTRAWGSEAVNECLGVLSRSFISWDDIWCHSLLDLV